MTAETPSTGNNPGLPRSSLVFDDVPTAIRPASLEDMSYSATNIYQMLDASFCAYQDINPNTPEQRAAVKKLGAFLWVIRDMAEVLAWQMEKMEKRELAGDL
jgi:hypothetical protein